MVESKNCFNGTFIVNPNFRELHSAEVPWSKLAMPLIRQIQSILRSISQGLFESLVLAKPYIVTLTLKDPYAVEEAVDDELVDILWTPFINSRRIRCGII